MLRVIKDVIRDLEVIHPVVLCKRPVDKGVLAIEPVKDRCVRLQAIHNEPDWFIKHRLSEVVIKCWEAFTINGAMFFKATDIKPVRTELDSQCFDLRILDHPLGLCRENGWLVQLSGGGKLHEFSIGHR